MTDDTMPAQEPPMDTAEAMDVYREIATKAGLIRSGDPMDQNLIDAFGMLVEKAAMVADEYETDHGNAGEHIRAVLYPY